MIAAILFAQWSSIRNARMGAFARGGIWTVLTNFLWFGFWTLLAWFAYTFTSDGESTPFVAQALPRGLMLMLIYWQLAPILVASLGASLDMKKLRVYPIPDANLYWVEVLLRLTTGLEMLLILSGLALGLMRNPVNGGWWRVPEVGAPLLLFILFNLLVAAGLRNLVERLLSHKRVREFVILGMVMLVALPQVLLVTGMPEGAVMRFFTSPALPVWPWTMTSALLKPGPPSGSNGLYWLGMLLWAAAAYGFGRWQFARSLRFDGTAARAEGDRGSSGASLAEAFFRLPGRFLPDPVAAVAEKELRTLGRASRFRLVFMMGFSFGLVIWLPVVFGHSNKGGFFAENFLALVSVYSLTLLGQVTYWNAFGFDRAAAQVYFSLPAPVGSALAGKNIAAGIFALLEISIVALVCFALRTPITWVKTAEAFGVTVVVAIFLFAAGNLASVHMPRPMNPERAGQHGSSGKSQAMVLLVYPFAALPAMLAYLGRYVFRSELAFFVLLGVAACVGAVVYWIALESAVAAAEKDRELIITELSRGVGPVMAE